MKDKEQTVSNLRKLKSFHNGSYGADIDRAIKALEQEPKSEWQHDHEILKVYSDGANEVLDKIRADVINIADGRRSIPLRSIIKIIDKYRGESEEV